MAEISNATGKRQCAATGGHQRNANDGTSESDDEQALTSTPSIGLRRRVFEDWLSVTRGSPRHTNVMPLSGRGGARATLDRQ